MKSRKIQRPVLSTILSLFLFLSGTAAIATSSGIGQKQSLYDIKAAISLNGREISSPHIVTLAGETASITQTGSNGSDILKFEIVATDVQLPDAPDAIALSADLKYTYGSGGIDSHEKFNILIKSKNVGTISFTDKDGHVYEMQIAVERLP